MNKIIFILNLFFYKLDKFLKIRCLNRSYLNLICIRYIYLYKSKKNIFLLKIQQMKINFY